MSHADTYICVTVTNGEGGGVDVLMALGCYQDLGFVLHYHLPIPAETLRTGSLEAQRSLCRHDVIEKHSEYTL